MLKVKFLCKSLIKNVSMCIAQAHRDTTMGDKSISHYASKIWEFWAVYYNNIFLFAGSTTLSTFIWLFGSVS